MKTHAAAALCSVVGVVGALAVLGTGPAAAAQGGGFAGTWTSIDSDGSNQVMTIRGSGKGSFGLLLRDDAGTVCGGAPAQFGGSGHLLEDGFMVAIGSVTCRPGGNPLRGSIALGFSYDAGSDTLTDGGGVVWSRL